MTTKTTEPARRGRGRPQGFDRCEALNQAMMLFWARGYEGTTFDDLIASMGISPSSFYNCFGSKERLYQEAIDTYMAAASRWLIGCLDETGDTRGAFERLLMATAEQFTREDRPPGCMISLAGTQVPPALDALRHLMIAQRARSQSLLADRLRLGVARGDVPADCDIEGLAAFYGSLLRGMAVQACDGIGRDRLLQIAKVAMRAWPLPSRGAPA